MSIPPTPPGPPPPGPPPPGPPPRSMTAPLQGALVATLVVALGAAMTGISGGLLTALLFGPVIAFLCVFVGSLLTISERSRRFAVGFLIASAILIFVSAGVCVATLSLSSGQI